MQEAKGILSTWSRVMQELLEKLEGFLKHLKLCLQAIHVTMDMLQPI